MCLVAFDFDPQAEFPLRLAANREESFARPSEGPQLRPLDADGRQWLGGLDVLGGGTWLGVNDRGVVIAVTNRRKASVPLAPRSRGLLCRDLLLATTAAEAAAQCYKSLATGRYAGANYLCLDRATACIIHAGNELARIDLSPGFHTIANADHEAAGDQRLARVRSSFRSAHPQSAAAFIQWGELVCGLRAGSHGEPPIVLKFDGHGTVSSTLILLGRNAAASHYQHADGPPDVSPYRDYSGRLRELLAGGERSA